MKTPDCFGKYMKLTDAPSDKCSGTCEFRFACYDKLHNREKSCNPKNPVVMALAATEKKE